MSLSVGIIGLPNVGKSTLFNALTSAGAEASNYPFCTIDRNVGVAAVSDPRLCELERLLEPEECLGAAVNLVDVAGLVRGAHKGEGLGNRFLGHVRETDALLHVVRCFSDENVAHTGGDVDPAADAGLIDLELTLADLEQVERALGELAKKARTEPKKFAKQAALLEKVRDHLAGDRPLRTLELGPREGPALKGYGFLTIKPVLYCANVDEEQLAGDGGGPLRRLAEAVGEELVLPVSARVEAELLDLPGEERGEYRQALGITGDSLSRVAGACTRLLDLITFYTTSNHKLRAWHVPAGTAAPAAAGRIHGDMEEGFIRAEVVDSAELLAEGSMARLQELGRVRSEGRDYEVEDGDVIHFLFRGK